MNMTMISDEATVVAVDNLAFADLDGEAVLLDVNSGYYYGLNEVGARVMDLIKEPTSMMVIKETLLQQYDVDAEQLEQDVMAFLEEMEGRKLIRVINSIDQ